MIQKIIKNSFERENLVEFFHKIILNNIIAERVLQKIQDQVRGNTKCYKEIKREIYLYSSEAVYYFRIAERQLRDENIIEIGI